MDKQTLIANLNEDLSGEFQAIIMYLTFAAKVTGPLQPSLSEFFSEEVADETGHAAFLARKIAAMGGTPTTTPRPVPMATTCRGMLEVAQEAETRAVRDYTQRQKEAGEYGDIGLQTELQNRVQQETEHLERLVMVLRDWERGIG